MAANCRSHTAVSFCAGKVRDIPALARGPLLPCRASAAILLPEPRPTREEAAFLLLRGGGEPHGTTGSTVMSATNDSTQVNASVVWQQLSEQLDALVAAWQGAAEPPRLADFVPGQPPELRRLTLVEAVKIDLEYRWQDRRWPKLVEEYLTDFPELAAEGGVSCDVIYEEYHIRKQQGDTVSVDEYCNRFPTRIDELRRLFQIDAPTQSTVMVDRAHSGVRARPAGRRFRSAVVAG